MTVISIESSSTMVLAFTISPSLAIAGRRVGVDCFSLSMSCITTTNFSPPSNNLRRFPRRALMLSVLSNRSTCVSWPNATTHTAKILDKRCRWERHSQLLMTACEIPLFSRTLTITSILLEVSRPYATRAGGLGKLPCDHLCQKMRGIESRGPVLTL